MARHLTPAERHARHRRLRTLSEFILLGTLVALGSFALSSQTLGW